MKEHIFKKDYLKRYSLYAGMIFLLGVVISFSTVKLAYTTFINGRTLLIVFVLGALLMGVFHRLVTKRYVVKISEHIALFIGYGMIAARLFLGFNTWYADPTTVSEHAYPIIEKRTQRSNGYKTKSILEYFVSIKYKDEKLTLKFPETDSQEMDKVNAVRIVSRQGYFGFEVIDSKTLINTEDKK